MMPLRTVPPDPQRFLSFVASASMSAMLSGSPLIVVTPLPALPCVSRATLMEVGAEGRLRHSPHPRRPDNALNDGQPQCEKRTPKRFVRPLRELPVMEHPL